VGLAVLMMLWELVPGRWGRLRSIQNKLNPFKNAFRWYLSISTNVMQ
jgi:hypothetical protein